MPKPTKRNKRPSDINPLVEYLVDESVREGGVPDAPTDEQISLLMAEADQKKGKKGGKTTKRKNAASKAAKTPRKKTKKPGRRG